MNLVRSVVVFDAAELHSESAFWAGLLGGHVFEDEAFHSVIDSGGQWRIGVQLAPNHVAPDWPDGAPQQVHVDLHVEDFKEAHEQAMALGARLLLTAPDLENAEGTRCTPTQQVTRSASVGGIRLKRRLPHSSLRGSNSRRSAIRCLPGDVLGQQDPLAHSRAEDGDARARLETVRTSHLAVAATAGRSGRSVSAVPWRLERYDWHHLSVGRLPCRRRIPPMSWTRFGDR